MFDVGFPELLLIAAVALVVLGPEQLPVVMRKIGRFVGALRRQLSVWQDDLERMDQKPRREDQPRPTDKKEGGE